MIFISLIKLMQKTERKFDKNKPAAKKILSSFINLKGSFLHL